MSSAQDIYQTHLDDVSAALWARDYDKLLSYIAFPSFIETDDDILRMETPQDYMPSLKSFRSKLDMHGTTAYYRICREAVIAHDDPNRIEGIHETFVLNGTTPVMEPYLNHMTLICTDGVWLGAGIRAATKNTRWKIINPPAHRNSSPDSPAEKQEH